MADALHCSSMQHHLWLLACIFPTSIMNMLSLTKFLSPFVCLVCLTQSNIVWDFLLRSCVTSMYILLCFDLLPASETLSAELWMCMFEYVYYVTVKLFCTLVESVDIYVHCC